MHLFFPLLFLFIISSAGVVLYFFRRVNQTVLNLLIAIGAGSMLSVALVHILTESQEASEFAVYAFMGGFLVIYLIEELLTHRKHDHKHGDHTHEDPHEHYKHVALVTGLAIFTHTLFDGLGIRAGFWVSETLGYSVLFGVAIHQIPVSLSLAAIFQESSFPRRTQIMIVLSFALAAPLGFFFSDFLLSNASEAFTALVTAFAGGSLLYVATADLLPVIHSQSRHKYWTVLLFVLGVVWMSAVKLLE